MKMMTASSGASQELLAVYPEFESFTKLIDIWELRSEESLANKYQRHKPYDVYHHIICFTDNIHKQDPVIYIARVKMMMLLRSLMKWLKIISIRFIENSI